MSKQKTKEINPADAKAVLTIAIETKDRDALWDWILEFLGYEIPREAICPDHCAPFDFITDYIFGEMDMAVVLGNRSGGKTLNFGILDTIMSYYSDNTEVATVGAIQFQAKKGYEYFKDFTGKFPFNLNIISQTMRRTTMRNGSEVQILTGTMSGVNSPHPQLLFLDEIDLMNWQVLQQAFSMPQSKHGVKARTVLTSTRKFAAGPMQRMIDEIPKIGGRLYQWCVWEVVEPLPEDPKLRREIKELFGATLPKNIHKANGYYEWGDVIRKYKTLDSDVWETEWICVKPGMEGLVYGTSYSDDNNLINEWSPIKRRGYIYLFEDFGFGENHPDVVLFAFVPVEFDRIIIFDELYLDNMGTDQIWEQIDLKLQEYGHRLPNKQLGVRGTVKGWVPDPHGLTEIRDRQLRGAPMMNKVNDPQLYLVHNGIKIVKRFLSSGRLMITDKCVNLRSELMSYSWRRNADGTYSNIPNKRDDHGPDALRYGLIRLYSLLASKAFGRIEGEMKKSEKVKKSTNIMPKTDVKPITAGILTEKF